MRGFCFSNKHGGCMANIAYTGVVLTPQSRIQLLRHFTDGIPKDWDVITHHMTICMGSLSESKKEKKQRIQQEWTKLIDSQGLIELLVTHVRYTPGVICVDIDFPMSLFSGPKFPHITVAIDRANGYKPFHSNKTDPRLRRKLVDPIHLLGKLTEVPNK